MKIGTWYARSGALLVLVSLLASCAPGSDPGKQEPDVGPTPAIASGANMVLPLDAYRLSKKDYIRVRRAAWMLTRDCVRRFGGDYTLSESTLLANLPGFEHDNDRRYGLFDATSAAERGYRVPPSETGSTDAAEKGAGWNPNETELYLVRGVSAGRATPVTDTDGKPLPEGGCSGEADRALHDGTTKPSNETYADEMNRESHKRSEADSRVRAVMAKWSECMARSGYTYKTIWEPNDYKWPPTPGATEIATAKADVACKNEVNLVGVWHAVETAYQKQMIEQNAERLKETQTYLDATIRNAARVVGG